MQNKMLILYAQRKREKKEDKRERENERRREEAKRWILKSWNYRDR